METIGDLGELGVLARLAERFGPRFGVPEGQALGAGDDAAAYPATPGTQTIVTTDLLVEDRHFRRGTFAPEAVGHKAMAANLSDLAAMGAVPRGVVLGLALPAGLPWRWLEGFYAGAIALLERHGVYLLGGDTVGTDGRLTIAVTALGETDRPRRRRDARPGDVLFLTGPVGGAGAGFWCLEHPEAARRLPAADREAAIARQTRPEPHLAIARDLQAAFGPERLGLLDTSDGLAKSLGLFAAAAGATAVLEAPWIDPVAERVAAIAEPAGGALGLALGFGEDYTLLGACEPSAFERHARGLSNAFGEAPRVVGRLAEGPPEVSGAGGTPLGEFTRLDEPVG